MRDPARIPAILKLVEQIWTANPDLRLGQLIMSAAGGVPFFTEDDKLEQGLRQIQAAQQGGKDHSGVR